MILNGKKYLVLVLPLLILIIMLTAVCSFANETKKGNEHFSKGNYAKAILHYKNELDERDEDGSLSYRIALCHLLQGNQMKAHSFFNRAKARNPNIFDGKTFKMPSGGMKPTLLVGDHIIADILALFPNTEFLGKFW